MELKYEVFLLHALRCLSRWLEEHVHASGQHVLIFRKRLGYELVELVVKSDLQEPCNERLHAERQALLAVPLIADMSISVEIFISDLGVDALVREEIQLVKLGDLMNVRQSVWSVCFADKIHFAHYRRYECH